MVKNSNFVEKLRELGLRPTRQRVKMCEVLFNREHTFHFTINDLVKMISEELNEKISLYFGQYKYFTLRFLRILTSLLKFLG